MFLNKKNLVSIAEAVGLDGKEAKEVVNSEVKVEEAHEKVKNWTRKGVRGTVKYAGLVPIQEDCLASQSSLIGTSYIMLE